jgi:ribonuclease HII
MDEVGIGAFAGPVVAASVIWNNKMVSETDKLINDSKQLTFNKRKYLAEYIKENAIDWSIIFVDNKYVDSFGVHNATFKAMHESLDSLSVDFDHIIVDGNKFRKYKDKQHTCVVKGDAKYISVAAASILAKDARDTYMMEKHIDPKYTGYCWNTNVGYGTKSHIESIKKNGISDLHRTTFIHF